MQSVTDAELQAYAAHAAVAAGLTVEDAWWPGVLRHLRVLLEQAAVVDAQPLDDDVEPGPVFAP